jgi:hypothetical protein
VVSPVALYPGTALYESVKERGGIDDSIWFSSKQIGILSARRRRGGRWVHTLVKLSSAPYASARGTAKRISARTAGVVGSDCWVTDILEGDYYLDEERYDRALELLPQRARTGNPRNLALSRMGKARFMSNATGGGARLRLGNGHRAGILRRLAQARREPLGPGPARGGTRVPKGPRALNPYDFRIRNIRKLLK